MDNKPHVNIGVMGNRKSLSSSLIMAALGLATPRAFDMPSDYESKIFDETADPELTKEQHEYYANKAANKKLDKMMKKHNNRVKTIKGKIIANTNLSKSEEMFLETFHYHFQFLGEKLPDGKYKLKQ